MDEQPATWDPIDAALTQVDALSGAPCPLRAVVRVEVHPPVAPSELRAGVVRALEAAIAHGQRRYGMYRDEMPSLRAAVEAAARRAFDDAVAREGREVRGFAILTLELADP